MKNYRCRGTRHLSSQISPIKPYLKSFPEFLWLFKSTNVPVDASVVFAEHPDTFCFSILVVNERSSLVLLSTLWGTKVVWQPTDLFMTMSIHFPRILAKVGMKQWTFFLVYFLISENYVNLDLQRYDICKVRANDNIFQARKYTEYV